MMQEVVGVDMIKVAPAAVAVSGFKQSMVLLVATFLTTFRLW